MIRSTWLAAVAVAGALVGALVAVTLPAGEHEPPAAPAALPSTTPSAPPTTTSRAGSVLLVWTTPASADFGARVGDVAGVDRVTSVVAGTLDLVTTRDADGRLVDDLHDGWRIPLDAIAVDRATYPAFVADGPATLVARLRPGDALLGSTSARLRRLGPGADVELVDGARVRVAGVVDDGDVGAAELVIAADDPLAGRLDDRYLLVQHHADRAAVEQAIRDRLAPGTAVRFRAPGETPFLRRGDAVLPQALVKDRFGEFSYRPAAGRDIEQAPAWQADHLVTATVPLLGRVRCHRAVVAALRGALAEIERDNLAHLVDPAGYAGCWTPRLIAPGSALSRHAWGIALDVNHPGNPTGVGSSQDPRLLDVLARWGFTTGAGWLVPDPAHIEFVRPPR